MITLRPGGACEEQEPETHVRVHLEWIDSRKEGALPLSHLLQRAPLAAHLRDLIQRASSQLLVKVLLSCSSSAELYHRCWQQRQQVTGPIISSIAASLRNLISNASQGPPLDAVLCRLDLRPSLPSIITIQNLLAQLDLATFPPTVPGPSGSRPMRKVRPLDDHQSVLETVDLAEEMPVLDFESSQLESQPALAIDDEHSDTALSIVEAPADLGHIEDLFEFSQPSQASQPTDISDVHDVRPLYLFRLAQPMTWGLAFPGLHKLQETQTTCSGMTS